MNKKMDSIKRKIRKLRALAADGATTEAETLSAIDAAEELMRKHDLTVKDLEEASLEGGIIKLTWGKGTKKIHAVEYCANAITQVTETKGWIEYPDHKAQLAYLGFEADVEYALYLTDLIHNAMEAEWEAFREGTEYAVTPRNQRGRMRDDFLRGMAARIREKLMDMVAQRRTNVPDVSKATGTELVVAKRNMIAEAMGTLGVDPRRRRKSRKTVTVTAYGAGLRAGERTNITTGIHADA